VEHDDDHDHDHDGDGDDDDDDDDVDVDGVMALPPTANSCESEEYPDCPCVRAKCQGCPASGNIPEHEHVSHAANAGK
jgi:hypothetical protein